MLAGLLAGSRPAARNAGATVRRRRRPIRPPLRFHADACGGESTDAGASGAQSPIPQRKSSLPTLTLFTKSVCPLCDEAVEQLAPFRSRLTLQEVDIQADGNDRWFELYRYEIPVFYLQEKFLCKNRIDLEKLEIGLKTFEAEQE